MLLLYVIGVKTQWNVLKHIVENASELSHLSHQEGEIFIFSFVNDWQLLPNTSYLLLHDWKKASRWRVTWVLQRDACRIEHKVLKGYGRVHMVYATLFTLHDSDPKFTLN